MFVGRQNELKKLNVLYNSDKFECVILYGRRRVGKTSLIREFCADKRSIYFAAQETTAHENMNNLIGCISALQTGALIPELDSWHSIITALFDLSRDERLVFIIDDYPKLAASHRGIAELINNMIDKYLGRNKLMLIISGAPLSYMENEVLSYESLFHGRRTAQIKLAPFTFFEARRCYNKYSLFDMAVIYGMTGGVPRYIELMSADLSIEENIRRSFFEPTSFLYEEPCNLLRNEIREPAYYNAVLRAIAGGREKNSEIAVAADLETSACTAYLKNLSAFGIVEKKTPITEKSGKKTVYEITDSLFRFWYKFVPENVSHIEMGTTDRIWRNVSRDIPVYMKKVFENICAQWLVSQNELGKLPIQFAEIGRWWGLDPVTKQETVVPVLAYSDDNNAIFAACHWSDDMADADTLTSLVQRSEIFRYRHRHLYLFSRSGFTEECAAEALRTGANLVMFQ